METPIENRRLLRQTSVIAGSPSRRLTFISTSTEELDESNNGAIQVLQVGSPDFGSAALVANVSPFTAHRGEYVAVGGQAYYDFDTIPGSNDFPVQNASMTARLIDPVTGQVLRASGGRTAINGNFLDTFRSPDPNGRPDRNETLKSTGREHSGREESEFFLKPTRCVVGENDRKIEADGRSERDCCRDDCWQEQLRFVLSDS